MLDNEDRRRASRSKRDEGKASIEPGAMMRKHEQSSRHAKEIQSEELKRVNRETAEVVTNSALTHRTSSYIIFSVCSVVSLFGNTVRLLGIKLNTLICCDSFSSTYQ